MKLQKFIAGTKEFVELAPKAQQIGMDVAEIAKELYGHMGYQDGLRFFGGEDPEKQMLKQKLQQAGQIIQELGRRVEDKEQDRQVKKEIAHEGNVTKLLVEDHKQGHENTRALASHLVAIDGAAHGRDTATEDRKAKAGEKKAAK